LLSLRTLLIGVTLPGVACADVGWQARIVYSRKGFPESSGHLFGRSAVGEGCYR
jgi:hypothetical protein